MNKLDLIWVEAVGQACLIASTHHDIIDTLRIQWCPHIIKKEIFLLLILIKATKDQKRFQVYKIAMLYTYFMYFSEMYILWSNIVSNIIPTVL